jgi:hypothetical protein
MVEHLPSNHKPQSSSPSTIKNEKKEKEIVLLREDCLKRCSIIYSSRVIHLFIRQMFSKNVCSRH